MFPICLGGAELDAENFEVRAARIAKSLRHLSFDDTSSCIFAFTTFPEGSTVMMTVTPPDPMHLYAGMERWLAFLPSSSYETTDGPE